LLDNGQHKDIDFSKSVVICRKQETTAGNGSSQLYYVAKGAASFVRLILEGRTIDFTKLTH